MDEVMIGTGASTEAVLKSAPFRLRMTPTPEAIVAIEKTIAYYEEHGKSAFSFSSSVIPKDLTTHPVPRCPLAIMAHFLGLERIRDLDMPLYQKRYSEPLRDAQGEIKGYFDPESYFFYDLAGAGNDLTLRWYQRFDQMMLNLKALHALITEVKTNG